MPSSSKEGFFMFVGPSAASTAADFIITYHGTVATVDALNDACLSWIEDNVAFEPWQRLGKHAVCIDPAFAEQLREALIEAGFKDHEGSRQ
jgi:hypothetical protein